MRHRSTAAAVAVASLLALAACGSSDTPLVRTAATETVTAPPVGAPSSPADGSSTAGPATDPTATAAAASTNPSSTDAATTALATTVAPAPDPSTTAPPAPTTTVLPLIASLPPSGPAPEIVPPLAAPIPALRPGASGPAVQALQQRLLALGFWVPDTDGTYGFVTTQAVMAFQKHYGLPASGTLDQPTADLLSFVKYRAQGQAWQGDVIEVDKSKQVLYIVKGGRTLWVINTATGTEVPFEEVNKLDPTKTERGDAVTPVGFWKVNRFAPKDKGNWVEGELGQIYRPAYFHGGIAVHGSNSIPNHPASHGCVRVSTAAMDFIWAQNYMPLKTVVWVHGAIPKRTA